MSVGIWYNFHYFMSQRMEFAFGYMDVCTKGRKVSV